ncbi:MAG: hypothetical protein V3U80_05940 [Flavobacteriaceae bacterium]
MKRITILLISLTIALSSCSGTKKTKKAISSGNYEAAFDNAVAKLTKNKDKYKKQIPLLKEAYDKEVAKDLAEIKVLERQNPKNYQAIYKKYLSLDSHQDEVILLEPLYFEGKKIKFKFNNYEDKIKAAKNKYSEKLFTKSQSLIYGTKENSREAYKILTEIQYVNPKYRSDLGSLIATAKKRGSDYIFVKLHNNVANQLRDSTSQSILKNFSKIRSGDFENKWIVLHDIKDHSVVYDYEADIYLDKITALPEKTNQQKVPQEKQIQTGWNYKKGAKGEILKDAEGNPIKIPKMENVRAEVMLYQQIKSTVLDGKIMMKNLKTGTISNAVPLQGEAKLENIYGTYKGEPKAIDQKYHKALQNKRQQFPPDNEFNKFALQTFKVKVEDLLAKQKY